VAIFAVFDESLISYCQGRRQVIKCGVDTHGERGA